MSDPPGELEHDDTDAGGEAGEILYRDTGDRDRARPAAAPGQWPNPEDVPDTAGGELEDDTDTGGGELEDG